MLNNLQQQHLHYLREAMVGLRGWDAATDGWKTYQWIAMEGDHQWKTIGEPQESGDLTILNHT